MRFRLCCTCGNEEKPNTVESRVEIIDSPPKIVPPEVISQQPKNVDEPIKLDRITEVSVEESRITEVSVEESSVQTTKEEQPPSTVVQLEPTQQEPSNQVPTPPPSPPPITPVPVPMPRQIEQKQDDAPTFTIEDPIISTVSTEEEDLFKKHLNSILAAKAAQAIKPPAIQPYLPINQESNIRVDTTIHGEILTFSQIASDLYRGTYKGSQFHIIQGNVRDDYFVFNESDMAAIKRVYIEAMKGMQRGMKELEGGVSALNNQEAWNPPPGSAINTNYFRRNGESAIMTFKSIGKGHFRSTYEDKEFSILNGRLLADDSFDEQDRELILQTYNNTLIGMKQGLLGMQQGMVGMQAMQMNTIGTSTFNSTEVGGTAYASTVIKESAFSQGGTIASNISEGDNTYSSTSVISGSAYDSSVGEVVIAAGLTTSSSYSMTAEGEAFAHTSKNLGTGRETLRKMHSLKQNKRRGLLEGGLMMSQPRSPVMEIEDITDEKPRNVDDVDGQKLT